MAVGIKAAGCAVNRNRVKRVVRERFRLTQQELPPVDVVVNARAGAGKATRAQLAASLAALFERMNQRCARS
jgi:ribonuclease P protein component